MLGKLSISSHAIYTSYVRQQAIIPLGLIEEERGEDDSANVVVLSKRGPEVEFWVEPAVGEQLAKKNYWSLLPFMALSDGAHTMLEDFSYFALLDKGDATAASPATDDVPMAGGTSEPTTSETKTPKQPVKPRQNRDLPITATSLFGIACTRQIKSVKLKRRSADVTRSTVQKAVVVISPTARGMGELRERLGVVTAAWFAQE